MMERQNAWENLEAIKEAHQLRLAICDMMTETEDWKELQSLAADITECEFHLQDLWKFERDEKFHRFWELPKCQCPRMDNEDSYPIGYYVTNMNCPIHGRH